METPKIPLSSSQSLESHTTAPVQAMADVLHKVAQESVEELSAETKQRQRAMLLAEASRALKSPAKISQMADEPPARTTRTWFALGGVSLAVAMAALVLFVKIPAPGSAVAVVSFDHVNHLAVSVKQTEGLFTIPAAQAQTKTAEEGIVINSRLPLTADQLRATVQVTPPVPVEVIALSKTSFRIVPKVTHQVTAASYRISVPTLVTNEDGSRVARDFTWSLESDNDLHVRRTIPGRGGVAVPVRTGIEFSLNHFVQTISSSTIDLIPPVPGRVEQHGQTLVFVPEAPLASGTYYQARLNQVTSTDGIPLVSPVTIQFETAKDSSQEHAEAHQVEFASEFSEVAPHTEVRLGLYTGGSVSSTEVDVFGYSLSPEQAQTLLAARATLPIWSIAARQSYDSYTTVAKQEAFRIHTTLEKTHDISGYVMLRLPKGLDAGFYAIKLDVPGNDARWAFVQVTRLASYTVADEKNVIVWAVNTETKKLWSKVLVQSAAGSALTNDQGIAELPAPTFFARTENTDSSAPQIEVLSLQQDTDRAFIVLSGTQPLLFARSQDNQGLQTSWGYLMADRPLYHVSDKAELAGIIMDRDTHTVPSDVHVQLRASTQLFDEFNENGKIYQDSVLTLDSAGRFKQTLSWNAMLPGYYSLALVRDGQVVTARSIEVREFTKPAYTIDVIPAATRMFSGAPVRLAIRAHFFDGTVVPGMTLKMTTTQGGVVHPEPVVVTLNAQGEAELEYTPDPITCAPLENTECHAMESLEIEVRPSSGEEGEILGTASVELYATALNLQVSQRVEEKTAKIRVRTLVRDVTAASEDTEPEVAIANVVLEGQAIGYYYEAIPSGTYYDFIEKVTKTAYRYERRRDPQPTTFRVQTDARGEASYQFTMNPARDYYEVTFEGRDTQGKIARSLVTVSKGWFDNGSSAQLGSETPHLVLTDVPADHTFELGQHVSLQYVHGTTPLPMADTPGVFVFTAARGLRDARTLNSNEISYTFDERFVPNAEVHAVTFWQGRFETAQIALRYQQQAKALNVTLKPVSPTVKPGEPVQVHIHVQHPDGTVAQDTSVALAAVDEALYALTGPQSEDPLTALYETVPSGVVYLKASHQDVESAAFGAGGGGMRGLDLDSRLQATRRTFKDTAAFAVVTLDGQGDGVFTFTAPDNLTSWRVTGVALTGALEAGVATTDIAVSQPTFVDVVVPPRMLVTDRPIMQLRAFGMNLAASSTVVYTVDAPTLGLSNVTVTGTAFLPSYLPITKPVSGTHSLWIQVQTGETKDSMERTVQIVDSFFTKQEFVTIDVAAGVGLPPLGQAQADIVLASTGRIELLPQLQAIAALEGIRLDTRVARLIAEKNLTEVYGLPVEAVTPSLGEYQSPFPGEGLKLLPYSSSDMSLTADVVATAPELFDQSALKQSFAGVLAYASSTRGEQIEALMGLASVHEPVVADLQAAARQKDLTNTELVHVIRGLFAAGDQATANELVTRLLEKTIVQDGQRIVNASTLSDRIEQTADLAAILAELHRPEAEQLYAYVTSVWQEDAFPILAKVRYLRARLATLPVQNGEVTWTTDGTHTQTIVLKDEPVHVFVLTASEAANFRITKATGPARLSLMRRTVGRPNSVPSIHLTRTYQASGPLSNLHVGDEITVTLTPRWDTDAREGCYLIRDHVPGGMQPVLQTQMARTHYYTNDFEPRTGEASFVSCKQENAPPITYRTRVVSQGTYTAEAPVMEHLEYPSIATVGRDEQITIR